ncbi:MAG: hypothetical protein ACI3VZ_03515 [Faecousia sp.]
MVLVLFAQRIIPGFPLRTQNLAWCLSAGKNAAKYSYFRRLAKNGNFVKSFRLEKTGIFCYHYGEKEGQSVLEVVG